MLDPAHRCLDPLLGAVAAREANTRPLEPIGVWDDIRVGDALVQQAFNMARRIGDV